MTTQRMRNWLNCFNAYDLEELEEKVRTSSLSDWGFRASA